MECPTTTTVININTTQPPQENYQYCGRGTIYGNPYSHLPGTLALWQTKTKADSIMRYRQWLKRQPGVVARIRELKGMTLGCHCVPDLCHVTIIARVADGGEP